MKKKTLLLIFGILLDIIGYLTFAVPALGEFGDVVWAPISAFLMYLMYKNAKGVGVGVIGGFLEEILPFTDFIPSFTLMWIYTYVFQAKGKKEIKTV